MRQNKPENEESNAVFSQDDAFTRLQKNRILFLNDEITSASAGQICAQILSLELEDSEEDIVLLINSQGGTITDTMAIYDLMQAVKSDVMTICIGEASSAGAILLSGGEQGKRFALPNARIMIHQPQGGIEGSTRDVEIEAAKLVKLREQLYKIFEKNTGQSRDILQKRLDRDTYMSAEEAKNFGIIDAVIDRLPEFPKDL